MKAKIHTVEQLKAKNWWTYLSPDLQDLFTTSIYLLTEVDGWSNTFVDYSFIVFPAAKAYEGFLKKLFLDMRLITEEDYNGTHFRIGKALNPQLEKRLRDDSWVFPKLTQFCGGPDLPTTLWNTWKKCRNTVFHWFPRELRALSLEDAHDHVSMIIDALDQSFEACRMDRNE